MSRWIGYKDSGLEAAHIGTALEAADAWRKRCFISDESLFKNVSLWTLENVRELKQRFHGKQIEGNHLSFSEKLLKQLEGAEIDIVQLAAEVMWFLLLFPAQSKTKPKTKREQVEEIWQQSGEKLTENFFLEDSALMGVGYPGTAYQARRHEQFGFFLDVLERWKSLPSEKRIQLMKEGAHWDFAAWVDETDHAEGRPMRNAILYFSFPDYFERGLSNEHSREIVESFKHLLSENFDLQQNSSPLVGINRAVYEIRKCLERKYETEEIDFYRPPVNDQWDPKFRKNCENARKEIGATLKRILSQYDLELRQCGSKKRTLNECKPVDKKVGFWNNPADATNKPLRWIIHLALEENKLVARVPEKHGSRRIAFANTAQGTSGAITARIIPAIRTRKENYVFHEAWEWMLLYCFLPPLKAGSSGQLFDDFNEKTGRLEYMGDEQPYISAALIALNEDRNTFVSPELSRPLLYEEATAAVRTLINVSPTVSMSETEHKEVR